MRTLALFSLGLLITLLTVANSVALAYAVVGKLF
jgi:hypothetical protein